MSYPPSQPQPMYAPPPTGLDPPLYGATIGQAITRFFKKYATFTGRASRSEYWWVALFSFLLSFVFGLIGLVASGGDMESANSLTGPGDILSYIWGLATVVPSLALGARRLHDINRSGWWQLIALIPLVGAIILIVWFASQSKPEGAAYDYPAR